MPVLTKILKYTAPELFSRLLTLHDIPITSTSDYSGLKSNFECWLHRHATMEEVTCLTSTCERIDAMTDDLGYQALMYVGRSETELSNTLPLNRHNLAVELFCHSQRTFRYAEEIRYANHSREGKAWASFQVPERPPFDGRITRAPLKEALQHYFKTTDPFYLDCFPLHNHWNPGIVQWLLMIYRGGIPFSFFEVDASGKKIHPRHYNPAWEYIILYTPATGVIEVVSAHRADRRELAKIFAKHCLETSMTLTDIALCRINLRPFYSEPALPFFLEKPVEEDILWVCVSGVGLRSPHTGVMSRHLCSLKQLPEWNFYQVMEEDHKLQTQFHDEKHYLHSVRLSIAFAASKDGCLPAEVVTFTISLPNRCTLKPHGIRHRYIKDVLFPRWGITQQ